MLRKWLLTLLLLLGLGAAIILSETPTGSLSGQIMYPEAVEPASEVQVVASGPVVRGVYVGEDGHYTISDLPTGKYGLRGIAAGFERSVPGSLMTVQEGQTTQVPNIVMEPLPPSLNLYSPTQVFTTLENPQINLRSSGLDQAQIEIYRFELEPYLQTPLIRDLADPYGYRSVDLTADLVGTTPLHSWQQAIPNSAQESWSVLTLELPKLQPGSYWVRAVENSQQGSGSADALSASYWLMVTDLGLVQKQSSERVVLQAINLVTLEPVPQTQIQLYSADRINEPPLTAITDATGLALIEMPSDQDRSPQWVVFAEAEDQGFQALSSNYFYSYSQNVRFYTYTDRPLYRPGQTVYYRSIIRRSNPEGAPLPLSEGTPVQVQVFDPDGDLLTEARLSTNRFSTVHGSFELPELADLGSYGLELVLPDDDRGYTSIQVEEYRKPEFQVTVTPQRDWIQQGDSVEVAVEAEYLFGGPVAGAEVHYLIYRSSDWGFRYEVLPRSPEELYFASDLDRDLGYYGGYGDVIAEGDAVTDEGGVARFDLEQVLKDFDWDQDSYYGSAPAQQLRIEAQVTDISRRSVTEDGRLRVTNGSFALFVESDRYVVQPGETVTYQLRSYDYDQKPISIQQGKLRLEAWDWQRDQWRKVRTILDVPFQTTAGAGETQIQIPDDLPPGNYQIRAETRDEDRNRIEDQAYLWVASSGSSALRWAGGPSAGITVIPDRQVYQIGDTAQIVITLPLPDAHALLTVEGSTLYDAEVKQIDGQVAVLELPITERFQPNVFYAVTVVGPDRQVYEGEAPIRVSPLDRFLNVEISSDQATYQPGETAQIRLQTRDAAGDPISAEVSLGVVDEAIYGLRADRAPDIRRFFYNRRYNQVRTSYSFPQQYPGGANKLANQIRQDFRDTAAWFPDVVTDQNGIADLEVTLPDNLTTWRLTARATTVDTQVGSAQSSIQVSKDLLVRLATPRFFLTGDRLMLTAVVQNQTAEPQQVQVRLETPSTLQPEGSLIQSITLPSQTATRVEWPTRVVAAGDTTVRIFAQANQLQDAMQVQIPIKPFGQDYRLGYQGRLTASGSETAQIELKVPEQVIPGSLEWSLDLASNPAGDLLGALDYLVGYPYGCTEQTLSRFLPTLAVAEAVETLDLPLQAETLNTLPNLVAAGLKRLSQAQNSDGGWGWWQWDQSNPYLTSYVIMGYHRAHSMGFEVDPDHEQAGIRFLRRAALDPEIGANYQIMAEYGLSLYGESDLQRVREFHVDQLSTFGLAYRALALIEMGDRDAAQQALDAVMKKVSRDKTFVWFQKADQEANSTRRLWQRFSYQDAEIAGPILQVATRLNDPRAEEIATWILSLRGGNRWLTTKETADAIVGLTAYYQARGLQNPADYQVILRNRTTGSPLGIWIPTSQESYQSIQLAPFDLNTPDLIPGSQVIEIEKNGSGPLFYSLNFRAFEPVSAGSTIGGVSQGFKVSRQYYTLTPNRQADGQIIYQERELTGSIPAGELLLGRVTVETDRDTHYVMIEEPLPSGAEIASQDPAQLTGDEAERDYWWNWFWTHQTVRDDRITFFTTELPQGTHEFVYLFRPDIPGHFLIPPTQAEEMYNPTQVFGQGASQELIVEE